MFNNSILYAMSQMQTPTLVALLIILVSIMIATFIFFGTKNGNNLGNYAKRYGWIYIVLLTAVVFPLAIALLRKVSMFWQFFIFPIIAIAAMFMDSSRGRIGRRRGFTRLFGNRYYSDELLDAPYYQGYDPIAMEDNVRNNQTRRDRENALKNASAYVKPYNDPMGDHTLQNNFCIFTYKYDNSACVFEGVSRDVNQQFGMISFKAVGKRDKNWNDEYFTSVIRFFSYSTNVNSLYAFFNDQRNFTLTTQNKDNNTDKKDVDKEENLVDVNTASEEELSKLPGINVVLAKKIVSYRESQGGYASVDDFIKTMGMKKHYANKIKKLIRTSKVEKVHESNNTRVLDI